MTTATLSPVSVEANAFVADRRDRAEELGRRLADEVNDPAAFVASLGAAFDELADPVYLDGARRIAPGIGALHGVRWPLIEAIKRGFRRETRHDPTLEEHWFAFALLERLVIDDTERAWQLLRRASQEAGDWITVDSLAHPVGRGILLEAYRWAELEQLVFSPSRWERRLVGSAIATMPHLDRRRGRDPEVVRHGLQLIGDLIGDNEPDVQKALAWALRALAQIDRPTTTRFLTDEAETAAASHDGQRAWVIRDALPKVSAVDADRIRERLEGIRRRPGDPNTSRAAEAAARFDDGRLGTPIPQPPLT
jgi:3-methyladenine DNA glycosylase AlkD